MQEQHFIHTDNVTKPADYITQAIRAALAAHKRVVWLLSGGSSINVAVAVATQLQALPDLAGLTILQVDERFGSVGHADSNWQALQKAGFDCPGATILPVLTGGMLEETVLRYNHVLTTALKDHELRIGLFGIGSDGHTAGMLPQSIASKEQAANVVGYTGPDFERITMTTPAISRLDLAVAYTMGQSKAPTLTMLRDTNTAIPEQPAQALKRAKAYRIYSDCY